MLPQLGISFQETMNGTYTRTGSAEKEVPRAFRMTAQARAEDVVGNWNDIRAHLDGTVWLENWVEDVPMQGTVEISPLGKRHIAYEFAFSHEGQDFRFVGKKEIRLSDVIHSMTHLDGVIYDADHNEVAKVRALFDVRKDLLPFLKSMRVLY